MPPPPAADSPGKKPVYGTVAFRGPQQSPTRAPASERRSRSCEPAQLQLENVVVSSIAVSEAWKFIKKVKEDVAPSFANVDNPFRNLPQTAGRQGGLQRQTSEAPLSTQTAVKNTLFVS